MDRRDQSSEMGGQALRVAGTPTYSLPSTGVVVPLPATTLELRLQPGQSLQLPSDGVSSWEVAWHRAETSQVADVLDIVQCGYPRGKRQLGARGKKRLLAGAGPELVVWLGSLLLEAGESSLSLLFAAPVGSGLNRELSLTELGHCVLPLEQEGWVSAAAHCPHWLPPRLQKRTLGGRIGKKDRLCLLSWHAGEAPDWASERDLRLQNTQA